MDIPDNIMTGGQRAAATCVDRYGADYFKNIGRKGGQRCVPKGFAANPELAREAGSRGGKKSKRGKAKKWLKSGNQGTETK